MNRLARRWVATGLAVFVAVPVLLGITWAACATHLYFSARALINSASEIRTTADAEREIAAWKKRSGNEFWVESRDVSEKTYKAEITNFKIARLGIMELTGVVLEVTMLRGKLLTITVAETTGSYPLASVWMREWFDGGLPNRFFVSRTGYPSAAVVSFPSSVSENQRARVFALNTNCFVRASACKTAENILPGVWQLDSKVRPD
jgi:hypothetical protein